MSCGECCATAMDICKEQFFSDMARLNLGAAAQQCIAECIVAGAGFGNCLLACMTRAATGNLRKVKRYVDDFNRCLAGQSNLCTGLQDCWCPWM